MEENSLLNLSSKNIAGNENLNMSTDDEKEFGFDLASISDLNLINPTVNVENPTLKLIRIENDFTRFAYLFHQYGTDGKLMFEIMSYLVYKFQYDVNLFQNSNVDDVEGWNMVFDVDDFSKVYGYRKSNLWRRHGDPVYLKYASNRRSGKDDSFFCSIIGNAIYRLYREKLDLSKQIGVTEKNKSIELIKELNNPDNTRGLKGQYIVEVTLDRDFIDKINKQYTLISSQMLVELNKRKMNLSIPYTHFSYMSNYCAHIGINTWDYRFDDICDILNISIKDPSDAKKKLKSKIKQIDEKSELELEVSFHKQTQKSRWSYGVRVHFKNNGVYRETEVTRNRSLRDAVTLAFLMQLTSFYKLKYSAKYHNNKDFIDWIGDENRHHEVKVKSYRDVFSSIVGREAPQKHLDKFFDDPKKFILEAAAANLPRKEQIEKGEDDPTS